MNSDLQIPSGQSSGTYQQEPENDFDYHAPKCTFAGPCGRPGFFVFPYKPENQTDDRNEESQYGPTERTAVIRLRPFNSQLPDLNTALRADNGIFINISPTFSTICHNTPPFGFCFIYYTTKHQSVYKNQIPVP